MLMAHSNKRSGRISLYPYLCILDDEEYVDAMLQVRTCFQPVNFTRKSSLLLAAVSQ